jgi:hypothetical protein
MVLWGCYWLLPSESLCHVSCADACEGSQTYMMLCVLLPGPFIP